MHSPFENMAKKEYLDMFIWYSFKLLFDCKQIKKNTHEVYTAGA